MILDDTIVAISSPPGESVRGIVRLSGAAALSIAEGVFSPDDSSSLGHLRGPIHVRGRLDIGSGSLPATTFIFSAPSSYTRQDIVEFHVLGSSAVLGLVVESCLVNGARRAEPGEFTARAFLAGAFDFSQIHGIAGMIAARSDHQLQAAERLLHGDLSRLAKQAREHLAELLSLVEGALDFADEPIEFITPAGLRDRLVDVARSLQATAAAGLRAERWGPLPSVVLVGRPNSGKSSLLNRLTGLDRAISTAIAGTTRDVLSAPLSLDSLDCLLVDIAGIEGSGDGDESIDSDGSSNGPDALSPHLNTLAKQAAREAIKSADLLLVVVDCTTLQNEMGLLCRESLDVPGGNCPDIPRIVVVNKADLLSGDKVASVRASMTMATATNMTIVVTSAADGSGCQRLKQAIESALVGRTVAIHDSAIALMAEHREALTRALEALHLAIKLSADCGDHLEQGDLVAAELRTAATALATLTGQEDTEALLGRIFSKFCVGK